MTETDVTKILFQNQKLLMQGICALLKVERIRNDLQEELLDQLDVTRSLLRELGKEE